MAILACAHSTAILTDHGPSELVADSIFYSITDEAATVFPLNIERPKIIINIVIRR